jgi:predicted acylesterase/phospholipase RssA
MEYCDLVMKGGITSGVVYPLGVVELARKYHFKNIGGTSAGAIAAAATAAAEYRRRHGSDEGFDQLGRLPDVLARDGFLFSLFQPDRTTKPLFGIALGLLKARGAPAIVATVLRGLATGYPVTALVGAALGAIVPAVAWYVGFASTGATFVLGSLWMALFAIVAAAIAAGRDVPTLLRRNWFGLCSGFSATAAAGQAPLTNWLHGYLNAVAGKPAEVPLTFGDLWNAPQTNDPFQTERAVHLEVLTTNLTHGRPYSLPFRDGEARQFYFSPEEWSAFFPPAVIGHMRAHAAPSMTLPRTGEGLTLLPLPAMEDLPVVVAARMSLSFPVLIAAVPLWAVDYSRTINTRRTPTEPPTAERCWFSDGGISSNFPLRFFDNPLPRWPTFGMNLKRPHPDHPNEADFVWLPTTNGQGLQPSWNRFDDGTSGAQLVGFFKAIIDTMQNWHDNMESRMPGYRNRIVHISQRSDEGGLNLDMEAAVIERLSERGRRAGVRLRDEFNWDNHAWVRYRSFLAALEVHVGLFGNAYEHPAPQDEAIWATIGGIPGAPPAPSYPWSSAKQAAFAHGINATLVSMASAVGPPPKTVAAGAPRPEPELRMTPKT